MYILPFNDIYRALLLHFKVPLSTMDGHLGVQSQAESYQRLKKLYLMPLGIIR